MLAGVVNKEAAAVMDAVPQAVLWILLVRRGVNATFVMRGCLLFCVAPVIDPNEGTRENALDLLRAPLPLCDAPTINADEGSRDRALWCEGFLCCDASIYVPADTANEP